MEPAPGSSPGWAVARSVTAHIVLVGSHGTLPSAATPCLPFPVCFSLSSLTRSPKAHRPAGLGVIKPISLKTQRPGERR